MTELLDWARPDVWRGWITEERLEEASADRLGARLRERFRALLAFHAARPVDPASYFRDGIAPLDRERWHALVNECFVSRTSDSAIVAAVVRARDCQFQLANHGRVHFCCDQALLEQRDGYHLLYGSLSLLAVAIQIDKAFGTDFKGFLRRRGAPLIFACEISTTSIEDDVLTRLAAALQRALSQARGGKALPSPFGFHFSIPQSLPASAIVGARPPRFVRDLVYGRHLMADDIGKQPGVAAPLS